MTPLSPLAVLQRYPRTAAWWFCVAWTIYSVWTLRQ